MSGAPLRFLVVGVGNTGLTYLVFWLLAVRLGVPDPVALAIGYVVGIANSYVWNRRWTFRSTDSPLREVPKFVVVNVATYGVNLALLRALVHLGMGHAIAEALSLGVTTVLSYAGQRFWAFRPEVRAGG